ncbi:hypothetical protein BDQ17DRAFT_1329971 [Cyathus striatus]|nr:hypothetical protein BDQ17DRAFT_1329971 [Cyathus striatus]
MCGAISNAPNDANVWETFQSQRNLPCVQQNQFSSYQLDKQDSSPISFLCMSWYMSIMRVWNWNGNWKVIGMTDFRRINTTNEECTFGFRLQISELYLECKYQIQNVLYCENGSTASAVLKYTDIMDTGVTSAGTSDGTTQCAAGSVPCTFQSPGGMWFPTWLQFYTGEMHGRSGLFRRLGTKSSLGRSVPLKLGNCLTWYYTLTGSVGLNPSPWTLPLIVLFNIEYSSWQLGTHPNSWTLGLDSLNVLLDFTSRIDPLDKYAGWALSLCKTDDFLTNVLEPQHAPICHTFHSKVWDTFIYANKSNLLQNTRTCETMHLLRAFLAGAEEKGEGFQVSWTRGYVNDGRIDIWQVRIRTILRATCTSVKRIANNLSGDIVKDKRTGLSESHKQSPEQRVDLRARIAFVAGERGARVLVRLRELRTSTRVCDPYVKPWRAWSRYGVGEENGCMWVREMKGMGLGDMGDVDEDCEDE